MTIFSVVLLHFLVLLMVRASESDIESFKLALPEHEMTFQTRFANYWEMTRVKHFAVTALVPRHLDNVDFVHSILVRSTPTAARQFILKLAGISNPYNMGQFSTLTSPVGMVPVQFAFSLENILKFRGVMVSKLPAIRGLFSLAYMAYSMALTLKSSYNQASMPSIIAAFTSMFMFRIARKSCVNAHDPLSIFTERVVFDAISLVCIRSEDILRGIPVCFDADANDDADRGATVMQIEKSKRAAIRAVIAAWISRYNVNVGAVLVPSVLLEIAGRLFKRGSQSSGVVKLLAYFVCCRLAVPTGLASIPQMNTIWLDKNDDRVANTGRYLHKRGY